MINDSDQDKLNALQARIIKAQQAADPARKSGADGSVGSSRMMVRAVRIGSDFVATVVISTGLGWFVDRQLDTTPWVMLAMLLVGFAVGFRMVLKAFDKGETADDQDHTKGLKE